MLNVGSVKSKLLKRLHGESGCSTQSLSILDDCYFGGILRNVFNLFQFLGFILIFRFIFICSFVLSKLLPVVCIDVLTVCCLNLNQGKCRKCLEEHDFLFCNDCFYFSSMYYLEKMCFKLFRRQSQLRHRSLKSIFYQWTMARRGSSPTSGCSGWSIWRTRWEQLSCWIITRKPKMVTFSK